MPDRHNDEIDLLNILNVLWSGKWWVIGITVLFSAAGVAYSLSLPDIYRSEGIYAPAQKQGVGGLMGQLGGLASLAGVGFKGGESSDIDQAIALITSWPFLERVIDKHKLKPLVMGVKGWHSETREIIWDGEIYDPVRKEWLRKPTKGKDAEPSSFEVYDALVKTIQVSLDPKTSLLKISVEHYSPYVARDWVKLLVDELNSQFRARDMDAASSNINYLQEKIAQTGIAEMRTVFYGMIETQMKTLMLAEVDEEYLVKTIVEPKVSERKSGPKRLLLVIVCMIAGSIFACVFLIARKAFT
jgi:uncharacterized protein involved in exopolysaccharide biosynthesis